jgi:hypothetical protein
VDPLGQSIFDSPFVRDLKKADKFAAPACYIYNTWTDEDDDIGDEVHDLNECYNPYSWVSDG